MLTATQAVFLFCLSVVFTQYMKSIKINLLCFQAEPAASDDDTAINVGPTVDYHGKDRTGLEWRAAIKAAVDHQADQIVVEGNAPHAVYAMIGQEAGPTVDIIFRQRGVDFRLPSRFPLYEPLVAVSRVVDARTPTRLLFIGASGHTFGDAETQATGLHLGGITSVTVPELRITPENYATVAGQLAVVVRHALAALPLNGSLYISMSVPTQLAIAVGVYTRDVVVPYGSHVYFLEKRVGGYFVY